jgi:hypothetical protein
MPLETALTTKTVGWRITISGGNHTEVSEEYWKQQALESFLEEAAKWNVVLVREPVVEAHYDFMSDRAECAVVALIWVANPPEHMRWTHYD